MPCLREAPKEALKRAKCSATQFSSQLDTCRIICLQKLEPDQRPCIVAALLLTNWFGNVRQVETQDWGGISDLGWLPVDHVLWIPTLCFHCHLIV
jgi:hypothetical protein